MSTQPALFLDRDGVINHRIIGGYVTKPSEFRLDPEILPLLQVARQAGCLLIVVTNQQGVGKGLMTEEDLDAVHAHMNGLLNEKLGFGIDHIYACTSLASAHDPRRKPSPGMLLEAIANHSVDPHCSWFVGDSITDAQAGRSAGVNTLLIGPFSSEDADEVVPTMNQAVAVLAGNLSKRTSV